MVHCVSDSGVDDLKPTILIPVAVDAFQSTQIIVCAHTAYIVQWLIPVVDPTTPCVVCHFGLKRSLLGSFLSCEFGRFLLCIFLCSNLGSLLLGSLLLIGFLLGLIGFLLGLRSFLLVGFL